VIAQSDVACVIGAQLDLQQTGFAVDDYAGVSSLIQVFPSDAELGKASPPLAAAFNADPSAVLEQLVSQLEWNDRIGWLEYVQEVRRLLPVIDPANVTTNGFVSPFELARCLSRATESEDIVALCSSGGMFTGALQVVEIAEGQIATVSPALASMGYGLATAIGAAFARPGCRVVTMEGDGGFAQNLQDLATVAVNKLPIKMFVAANEGYSSIRATQRKFFDGAYVGCDISTGLGFPDWKMLFAAYGIPCEDLTAKMCTEEDLRELIGRPGPAAWIVPIDPDQTQWPNVSSRILPDGSMVSNPLSKMSPLLDDELAARVERYLP
jgi:acetolactate synthase-1/2/3 large subunit